MMAAVYTIMYKLEWEYGKTSSQLSWSEESQQMLGSSSSTWSDLIQNSGMKIHYRNVFLGEVYSHNACR